MATATEDDDLAATVHRLLATLTDLRGAPGGSDLLLSRLTLARWLRQELGAVESLLTRAAERAPDSTGTVTDLR